MAGHRIGRGEVQEEEIAPVLVPGHDHVREGAERLARLGIADVERGAEQRGLRVESRLFEDVGEDRRRVRSLCFEEHHLELGALERHQARGALLVAEAGGHGARLFFFKDQAGGEGDRARRLGAEIARNGVDPAGAGRHRLEQASGAALQRGLSGAGHPGCVAFLWNSGGLAVVSPRLPLL